MNTNMVVFKIITLKSHYLRERLSSSTYGAYHLSVLQSVRQITPHSRRVALTFGGVSDRILSIKTK
jgi:hypothetical protein